MDEHKKYYSDLRYETRGDRGAEVVALFLASRSPKRLPRKSSSTVPFTQATHINRVSTTS